MRPHLLKYLCIIVATVLMAVAGTTLSLSRPAPTGYSRLLGRQAAIAPDAVTDCRMAAARLHAVSPDTAIPDEAFDSLLLQCRQAAKSDTTRPATARM
ncbi:hypothetical protein [Desulfovibrio sp. TomC]|uniref:hypothetical protein n=1 Tax=Desulfovibrio sp. TomC TaxID=1562888 RepID=UPI000574ADCA|nr:hypothetical protein [Desulfovibrio sp. TomC]KHK00409.1 hypothetical protein NY78_4158 [Desulfovibrio sp. TomC]